MASDSIQYALVIRRLIDLHLRNPIYASFLELLYFNPYIMAQTIFVIYQWFF